MTEELSPETVTDADVDAFFSNEGEVKVEAPVVEEVKAEEPKEEPKPEEEKKVNLGALHEERAKRKAEAERAKKAEERAAELERKLQELHKPQVDFDEDPVEALRRDTEQVKKVLIAQANAALAQTENEKYWERVKQDEIAFKQDKPDFDDAVRFLANSRIEELKDLGWSETEAAKVLQDEIKWITDKAYDDEANPAERFYALAKRRGFSKPVENKAEAKLQTIKKGMESNKALPPASKSVNQDLTAEALADMKVDALTSLHGQTEFDKAWAKLFG